VDSRCTVDARGSSDGPDFRRGFLVQYAIDHVYFTGLEVTGGYARQGGGLVIEQFSEVTITSCAITGNTALEGGGAIYVAESSVVTIDSSEIMENSGGGIWIETSSTVTITGSEISGTEGDGIYVRASVLTIVSSEITNNAGRGVYNDDYISSNDYGSAGGSVDIYGTAFAQNDEYDIWRRGSEFQDTGITVHAGCPWAGYSQDADQGAALSTGPDSTQTQNSWYISVGGSLHSYAHPK
jgi:parallel beta-helix repeat protein